MNFLLKPLTSAGGFSAAFWRPGDGLCAEIDGWRSLCAMKPKGCYDQFMIGIDGSIFGSSALRQRTGAAGPFVPANYPSKMTIYPEDEKKA